MTGNELLRYLQHLSPEDREKPVVLFDEFGDWSIANGLAVDVVEGLGGEDLDKKGICIS